MSRRIDAVERVAVELDCDAGTFDDHSLKCASVGVGVRSSQLNRFGSMFLELFTSKRSSSSAKPGRIIFSIECFIEGTWLLKL